MSTRVCKVCGETKEAVQGTWVFKYGKPHGRKCLACSSALQLTTYHADPEGRAKQRAYYHADPDGKAKARAAYHANPSRRIKALEKYHASPDGKIKARAASAKLRSTPEGRAKHNAANSVWVRNNLDKANALHAKRKAAKLSRTPKWADLLKIAEFYKEANRRAKETGVMHSVDHIIPLKGKLVSGLHVHTNLQVITLAQNNAKSNIFIV